MQKIILLALILLVASATIPGCNYFSNDSACFQNLSSRISGCKTYTDPFTCNECFPGLTKNAAATACQDSTTYQDWTRWPATGITGNENADLCKSWVYQLPLAYTANIEGGTAYTWNYAGMSCATGGQLVCETCQDGNRIDTTSNQYSHKCVSCNITNCLSCTYAATGNTCNTCAAGTLRSTDLKTCATCGTGMLTCSAVGKALTCLPAFFKDGDNCTACRTNAATCTNATTDVTCISTAYLDGTECKACTGTDVIRCTANNNTSIVACKSHDGTNVYYKTTADGCISHAWANKCATI